MLQRFLQPLYYVFAFFFAVQAALLWRYVNVIETFVTADSFYTYYYLTVATFVTFLLGISIMALWVLDVLDIHNEYGYDTPLWQHYLMRCGMLTLWVIVSVAAGVYSYAQHSLIGGTIRNQSIMVAVQGIMTAVGCFQIIWRYYLDVIKQRPTKHPIAVVKPAPAPTFNTGDIVQVWRDSYAIWYGQRSPSYLIEPQNAAYTVFKAVEFVHEEGTEPLLLLVDTTDSSNSGIIPTRFLYKV